MTGLAGEQLHARKGHMDTPDDQMSSGAFKFLEYSGNFDFFSHESKKAPSHEAHKTNASNK
jgi:hypothetical protein